MDWSSRFDEGFRADSGLFLADYTDVSVWVHALVQHPDNFDQFRMNGPEVENVGGVFNFRFR